MSQREVFAVWVGLMSQHEVCAVWWADVRFETHEKNTQWFDVWPAGGTRE